MINLRAFVLTLCLALVCALQFVSGIGVSDVYAYGACVAGGVQSSREEAYQCAVAAAQALVDTRSCSGGHVPPEWSSVSKDTGTSYTGKAGCQFNGAPYPTYGTTAKYWWSSPECPAGKTWNEVSKTCFSAAACMAKPPVRLGILNLDLVPGKATCDSGCEFVAQGGTASSYTTGGGEHGNWYVGGQWKPSGAACSAGQGQVPASTSIPKQECVTDSGSGVPVCIKADTGEHCVKFQDGRQSCWKPFETGEKTDGAKLQVRNAGSLPTTPQTPPPPGDTFAQQGAATTTSITNVDPQGATRSATMTTTNYATVGGANAGQQDQGEPGDGSGGSSGSSGGSDEERNSLLSDIKDALRGDHSGDVPGGNDGTGLDATAESVMGSHEYGAEGFDQSGFGYSRTCPAPPTVVIRGETFTFDADGVLCDWITAGGWFVIMLTGIACMRIVVGGGKS